MLAVHESDTILRQRYRLTNIVGQGGMGTVWEAEQERPRRRVALKVMRRDHLIDDFHARFRPRIVAELEPHYLAGILGNTESEYLFAVLRQLLANDPDLPMEAALAELMGRVEAWADGGRCLLNVVVSDGERLYAARHALNDGCPSLYYTTDDELFPEAQLIASERLTESSFWRSVPEHQILILDPEEPPELLSL